MLFTRLTSAISNQEWLNPIEERLQRSIRGAFRRSGPAGHKVKNFLHGTWVGHPLHVILTDIPIGSWTAATAFDAIETITGREEFAVAADTAITFGIVGALGAAITGITDWQDVDAPARHVGLAHALLNVGGLTAFTGSLLMRRRGDRRSAKAWSLLGFALSATAANFGGNLVYEQRIGVDHGAGQTLPQEFVAVLPASELIDGQLARVQHEGVPILLVKRGARIFALAETCSHLGGPLSEGKLVGDTVQCPWHASRFSLIDGNVVDGPAVHPVGCLDVRERNGQIEVRRARGRRSEYTPPALPRAEQRPPRTGSFG